MGIRINVRLKDDDDKVYYSCHKLYGYIDEANPDDLLSYKYLVDNELVTDEEAQLFVGPWWPEEVELHLKPKQYRKFILYYLTDLRYFGRTPEVIDEVINNMILSDFYTGNDDKIVWWW